MAKKNMSEGRLWATRLQVACDRLTDVIRQRQLCPTATLAPDGDPAVVPIDIIKAQCNDLTGPNPSRASSNRTA